MAKSMSIIFHQRKDHTRSNRKGFAVYTPGNLRHTKIKLKIIPSVDYSKETTGNLYYSKSVVTYTEAFLNLSSTAEYSLEGSAETK
jgi:hypothetical protein